MRILLLQFCLFSSVIANSQSNPLPLNFGSYAIKLGVAKDETLVMTTRIGEVGWAGSIKGEWLRRDVKAEQNSFGTTLDQPNFFNKDTGFVSGFINSKNAKYDIIYHTTNGGVKWTPVKFGQDGWVDDAVNLDNGEAWLSVAGSGIAYTSDYGFTWSRFKNPEIKQRFATIYFNTQRQGIVGSLWNMIAYTNDNCQNWNILPTPLDQKKYKKTNQESRPEFDRVAIYKNYLLASQEGLVFYSRRDSINWIWLPNYNDFYTDAANSALFFKTNKGNYVRSDDDFQPVHSVEIKTNSYDAKCKGGSLFIVGQEKMIQLNTANQVISTSFSASEPEPKEPVFIGYYTNKYFGFKNDKIYIKEINSAEWKYAFTFPYPSALGKISIIEDGRLLYDRQDDSIFYYNLEGRVIEAATKSSKIQNFARSNIAKIIFSEGSRGCFHNISSKLIYSNIHGSFSEAVEINDGRKGRSMPENEDIIEEEDVKAFMNMLHLLFDFSQVQSIEDLGFTASEYERCKKDILAFKSAIEKGKKIKETGFVFYRNNLDFDRLLSLVDSVKNIDPRILQVSLMNLAEIWSTTTNWKTIQFINDKDETLSITSNFYEPNAFYFPWNISLNGQRMFTTNIEINRFIEKVYPAFLKGPNRVSVIHKLVKDLY